MDRSNVRFLGIDFQRTGIDPEKIAVGLTLCDRKWSKKIHVAIIDLPRNVKYGWVINYLVDQ
ncbi:hypothetical protein AFR_08270 [Actinoplanes friuliensis DSM 7358]|uniref:Uncharacterized protein n=1 Tax=Actinoplanes friuliensis DSM 7358 TaxID=1246995 RepID=U5VSH1_9ACTN|nr:hypothetical protein AFR_08270 [Actinoplanes friuliensis DSM 7358]